MGGSQPAALLTLLKPSTVAAYVAAGFWGDDTIYHVAARASRIGGVISPPHARRRLMGSLINGCACRVAALVARPRRAQDKRPRPQHTVRS